jgi:hypothetical protein
MRPRSASRIEMACCWSTCAFARNLENGGRPSEASRLRATKPGSFNTAALDQIWPLPPSTNSSLPVTKLESSEARNSAALAISSGSLIRPIGIVETIRAINVANMTDLEIRASQDSETHKSHARKPSRLLSSCGIGQQHALRRAPKDQHRYPLT